MSEGLKLKQEREEEDPSFLEEVEDDDLLDDAGDLEFYDKTVMDPNFGNMYLTRVPPYVWEAWDKLPDDAEIEIGRIRKWYEGNGKEVRLRMLLHNHLSQHQSVPKEYDLKITDLDVKNTFVFTEEDLPHFKDKNRARQEASAAGIPAHLFRSKVEKPAMPRQPRRRGQRREFYRKAIPKKTRISGRIKHELNCVPVDNPESDHLLALRAAEAAQPTSKAVMFDEHPEWQMSQLFARGMQEQQKFQNFIVTAPTVPPPTRQKKTEMKTVRVEWTELTDAILKAFSKYKYWSMKNLRAEIKQPEAYIREGLDKLCELHKTGPFANTWSLKDDYRKANNFADPESLDQAPDGGEAFSSDEGEEDADVKMEDVI